MQVHPLPSPSHAPPVHGGALARLLTVVLMRTHAVAVGAGFLVRFAFLSALACLLFTSPISLNEVPYASHRPSSGR